MAVREPASYDGGRRDALPKWRWNPYLEEPPAPLLSSGVVADEDRSLPVLARIYQEQVAALTEAHEEIMRDKRQLETLLEPYMTPNGQKLAQEPSEDILMFKEGLDIRLQQFNEDCNRASRLEWVLQRKLQETSEKESKALSTHPCQVQATCEALKKVKDQERLIKILQHELDEQLYYNDLFAEQLRRMRGESALLPSGPKYTRPYFAVRTLHQDIDGSSKYTSDWAKMIRVNPEDVALPSIPPRRPPEGPLVPGLEPPRAPLTVKQAAGPAVAPAVTLRDRPPSQPVPEAEEGVLSQLFKALGGITAAADDLKKTAVKEVVKDAEGWSRRPSSATVVASPRRRVRRDSTTTELPGVQEPPRSPRAPAISRELSRQGSIRSVSGLPRVMLSRTLSGPQAPLRAGTRTIKSPRSMPAEQLPTSLTRAVSSAFLGG
ncbi:rna-binding protein [Cystoisospora suis]|uniref:Rna-binding protein n=1 Tax=Cystoisospora suis TaxID=483139 RepID=A0A2C6LG95_9APIC|nr:rna-binding protein [Cystoisospora suis]